MTQLESQLPDSTKQMLELVQMTRRLNRIMGTSFYSPGILKEMPYEDVINLIFAASLVSING